MKLTQKYPDDPDREPSEYVKAAWGEAEKFYSELANRFPYPPEFPEREEPQIQSIEDLAAELKPKEDFYDAVIIYDPERRVLILPFGAMCEVDLDGIKDARDLLLHSLAALVRHPIYWDKGWDRAFFAKTLTLRIAAIKGWD
jgi:hypothetical protein